MKKISFFIIFICLGVISVKAQYVSKYRSPVDFTIVLAGNLGEVRANHFHSGIDIKALRGVGSPIYAVADGYVSRIGVAPNGYGNFLMVTHKDGTSSLYAHLDDFSATIKRFVTQEQLKAQRYALDLYLTPDKFPVKSGDVIAKLGNSGSSGGPHLHFEIRDSNANSINVISRGIYHVPDREKPICSKLFVYQCDTIDRVPIFSLTQTISFVADKSGKYVPSTDVINISKPAYFAYEVIDYKDGKTNTMGIYELKQTVDSVVNFEFAIDKVNFSTSRFINSYVQYDKNRESKRHVVRAYLSPNNKLDIYNNVVNRGVVAPPKVGQERVLQTSLFDEEQNETKIKLRLINDGVSLPKREVADNEMVIDWNSDKFISRNGLIAEIPFGALYDNEILSFGRIGDSYVVGKEDVALQKNVSIRVKEKVDPKLQNSVCLARVKPKGGLVYAGGKYQNGEIVTDTKTLGSFVIAYDSIAPTVRPIVANGSTLKSSVIKFKITDDLSGVKKYDIFIDDKWAIGEYDPKNALLQTKVVLSQQPKEHSVKVVVIDSKGNIANFKTKYRW